MKNLYTIVYKNHITGEFVTKIVNSKDWHLTRQRCRNSLQYVDNSFGEKGLHGKGHHLKSSVEGFKIINCYGETEMEGYFFKEQVK